MKIRANKDNIDKLIKSIEESKNYNQINASSCIAFYIRQLLPIEAQKAGPLVMYRKMAEFLGIYIGEHTSVYTLLEPDKPLGKMFNSYPIGLYRRTRKSHAIRMLKHFRDHGEVKWIRKWWHII